MLMLKNSVFCNAGLNFLKLNSSSICTCRDVNQNRLKKITLLLRPKIFFFLTHYFGKTHRLMYRKWHSFVFTFVINSHFFQTTPSGYSLQSWKLACFMMWTILFKKACFRYLSIFVDLTLIRVRIFLPPLLIVL